LAAPRGLGDDPAALTILNLVLAVLGIAFLSRRPRPKPNPGEVIARGLPGYILLPIVGIVYPLWSLFPKFYRWQMQRRVYRCYGELRLIEEALGRDPDVEHRARLMARAEELERRVLKLRMPRSFIEMSYNLRAHVRALREPADRDS
jgi:hypothetical protein